LSIAAFHTITATMAGNTIHHIPNRGLAIRARRFFVNPQAPRRAISICANSPAMTKKAVMRNRWMTKKAT
jgi:hypothetical protein